MASANVLLFLTPRSAAKVSCRALQGPVSKFQAGRPAMMVANQGLEGFLPVFTASTLACRVHIVKPGLVYANARGSF
jgi:hypothetical protein